jgi:NADH-quinone oxidoreductase subunit L
MENFISIFLLIPLLGFIINTLIDSDKEKKLARVSFGMMGIQLVAALIFTAIWLVMGAKPIYQKQLSLLKIEDFELYFDFVFDQITAVYLVVGAFIAFLITTYSRNYLHREKGFKRFFSTILFFYLGYNIIVLSCNLTSIFVGWEVAGISSFLLIAYYRNRYIPVRNAVKIFALYRLGDVCIILSMWFSHHIWHQSISLHAYRDVTKVLALIAHYPGYAIGFSICIFTAAAIKSAQFPFSTWLPRAMEGPTPSSAIFYSSLAVHLGLLFLLRTYNFWIHVPYMQYVVIGSGALSFVMGTVTARIQPSIKGQLAYAIIAQVGLMAIEVALGLHVLVLIHFASHAMLRSYQLLISPSVVSYSIKKQFFQFEPIRKRILPSVIRNISNSIYILSLNEWKLDRLMYQLTWGIYKQLGVFLNFVPEKVNRAMSLVIWVLAPIVALYLRLNAVEYNQDIMTDVFLVGALYFVLKVFVEKEKAYNTWYGIASMHILLCCALVVDGIPLWHLSFYVIGMLVSFLLGYFSLEVIRKKEGLINLYAYQGHCYEHGTTEFFFLVACLGMMGFPVTTGFLGVELLFHGIKSHQYVQIVLLSFVFMLNGLSMIRMYARIFLGPHIKTYHEQARTSS